MKYGQYFDDIRAQSINHSVVSDNKFANCRVAKLGHDATDFRINFQKGYGI